MEKLDLTILEKLGKFTNKIKLEVVKIPKIGVGIKEIIDYVEKEIFKNGYLPAFPCTVSVNEVAAHYTVFDENYILKKSDLVKIDFGVSYNGFITDTALTIEVEDNKHQKLLETNKIALDLALKKAEIGVPVNKIGEVVNKIATKEGFNTIHNLSGHQIGINDLHCGISIPNYDNLDKTKLSEESEFAIEPFFTYGNPMIKYGGNSNILHLKSNKPLRDPIAKKVLNYIKENYPHLPFSKRWLIKDIIKTLSNSEKLINGAFDKNKVLYALKILKFNGLIQEYETLVSVDGELVSQFEETVVFIDKKKVIITDLK